MANKCQTKTAYSDTDDNIITSTKVVQ